MSRGQTQLPRSPNDPTEAIVRAAREFVDAFNAVKPDASDKAGAMLAEIAARRRLIAAVNAAPEAATAGENEREHAAIWPLTPQRAAVLLDRLQAHDPGPAVQALCNAAGGDFEGLAALEERYSYLFAEEPVEAR